jgi:hypothetical protein
LCREISASETLVAADGLVGLGVIPKQITLFGKATAAREAIEGG